MEKSKLAIIILLGIVTFTISCNSSSNGNENHNKSTIDNNKEQSDKNDIETQTNKGLIVEAHTDLVLKASGFVRNLQTGKKLNSFFQENWIFIYHEDNRCDGSTDGQIDNLKSTQIDSKITFQVKNDGDGWACDKKEPKTYDIDFDLKKKVANWDRFEIPHYEHQEENIIYVLGAAASDYLKLHYDDNNLIVKLEYRSEDPG